MDGLSGVASGFAVVSLAAQLMQGFISLHSLLSSIRDAPDEIVALRKDIDIITQILGEINANEKAFGMSPSSTIMAVELCNEHLQSLNDIANSLVPGFLAKGRAQRTWTAITAVRKKEKVSAFKEKLNTAKLNLLLARGTASDHSSRRHFQEQKESMVALEKMMADLLSRNVAYSQHKNGLSSEFGHTNGTTSYSSYSPFQPIRRKLESELIEAVAAAVANLPQINTLSPTMLVPRQQHYRKMKDHTQTAVPLLVGEIQSYSTTYQCIRDDDELCMPGDAQSGTQISFRCIPSWWVRKLGVSSVVQLDMLRSSTQGWMTAIRTYNMVPSKSILFEFCRDGNIAAMRRLLANRQGSINDISEYGETLLHIAAGRNQAEICALLLREGADQNFRDNIRFQRPFLRVCQPSESSAGWDGEPVTSLLTTSSDRMISTMRVFLAHGEAFEDSHHEQMMWHLMNYEQRNMQCTETPSTWLLNDIIPATFPLILDQDFWGTCLYSTLQSKPGDPYNVNIIEKCDQSTVRQTFMEWVDRLSTSELGDDELKHRDFCLLREKSGGLHFLNHESYINGPANTLLQYIRYSSNEFCRFREHLKKANVDLEVFATDEVEVNSDGWTYETLITLLRDEGYPPVPNVRHAYERFCFPCQKSFPVPSLLPAEGPWRQRVDRIKAGIDPNDPLSEKEECIQKEWERVYMIYKGRKCESCSLKG